MSRKLATIVKDSKIPGKYKRVLEAYAAFANNDGTNIYASQERIGGKASSSRRTIVRITPDLIASGVLRHGENHTCKVKGCNGGSKHYCGHNGKWTNVYEINLGLVQNVPNLLETNCLKACESKCRKPRETICLTDSGIKGTPAPAAPTLGKQQDSSAVPAEIVSERASSPPAAAAVLTPSESKWNDGLFTEEGRRLLRALYPETVPTKLHPRCEEVALALNAIGAKHYNATGWYSFFEWQHSHKPERMKYRDFDQFMAGYETSLNDYATHDSQKCKVCFTGLRKDSYGKPLPSYRQDSGQRSILGKGDI